MRKILVLNLGSTSYKFKLYQYDGELEQLAKGEVESLTGKTASRYRISALKREAAGESAECRDHFTAFSFCQKVLTDSGVLRDLTDVDAICYKAVHGGRISGTRVVDNELLAVMKEMVPFAPTHNPIYIQLMEAIRSRYPSLLQLAHFETAFHQTIPEERTVYGVNYEWYEKYGIRKYGFHGSSHEYIAGRMKQLDPTVRKLISIHLGGSCSLCAIDDGRSVASSMGATPQSGLFQNNRVGDFDCFCLPTLAEKLGSYEEAFRQLGSNGGLLGVSGLSNDMREVLTAAQQGDHRADLAVRSFVDGIVGYIGMFTAYLQGLDGIVFTGGIGRKSGIIREMVCERLKCFGVILDEEANRCTSQQDILISAPDSRVKVYAVETNEELVLARETVEYLNGKRK
jgi:acetate kinase